MTDRAAMNPVSYWLDVLGLPQIHEVVPVPGDVAKEMGIPTPRDVLKGFADDVKSKAQGIGRRF
jgi:hypothetical protein